MHWLHSVEDYAWRNPAMRTLIIVLIIGIVVAFFFYEYRLEIILGPIIGALISVIAVLGNEAVKYYSSTSVLRLSIGLEHGYSDPGLDVEVFGDGECRQYRVSAMVINNGNAIIKDAKASLTIKARSGNQEDYYLGGVIMHRSQFNKYSSNPCAAKMLESLWCWYFRINEHNPHVIGESLPWALPEKTTLRLGPMRYIKEFAEKRKNNSISFLMKLMNLIPLQGIDIIMKLINDVIDAVIKVLPDELLVPWPAAEYQYITSISPGQRNRLMIFTFTKLSNKDNVEYLVAPYSEYGSAGPYRACLRLTNGHKLIFEVTVHGEGARSPLRFKLCLNTSNLSKLEDAINTIQKVVKENINDEEYMRSFSKLLKALNGLKC